MLKFISCFLVLSIVVGLFIESHMLLQMCDDYLSGENSKPEEDLSHTLTLIGKSNFKQLIGLEAVNDV